MICFFHCYVIFSLSSMRQFELPSYVKCAETQTKILNTFIVCILYDCACPARNFYMNFSCKFEQIELYSSVISVVDEAFAPY